DAVGLCLPELWQPRLGRRLVTDPATDGEVGSGQGKAGARMLLGGEARRPEVLVGVAGAAAFPGEAAALELALVGILMAAAAVVAVAAGEALLVSVCAFAGRCRPVDGRADAWVAGSAAGAFMRRRQCKA